MEDLIYTLDVEQRYTSASGAWKETTGYSADEIIGRHFDEILPDEEKDSSKKSIEAVLKGKSTDYEWKVARNGERLCYRTLMNPMLGSNGDICGVSGVIQNTTKLKEAETETAQDCSTLEACNNIFQLSFDDVPLKTIFEKAIEAIISMPNFSGMNAGCGIYTFENDPETLVMSAGKGFSDKIKESVSKIKTEGHYLKKVLEAGTPQFIDIYQTGGSRYAEIHGYNHYCVPLVHSKKSLGIIDIFLNNGYVRNGRASACLDRIASALKDVVMQKNTEKRLEDTGRKFQKMMDRTIFLLSTIIEQKDPYIVGHQQRVGKLASNIAWELKLSDDQIHCLFITGLLHDIGKISIPFEILVKPGKLHEYELNLIKLHVEKGYDLLKNIDFPWPVAEIEYQHHERLNGSGYPRGLTEKDMLPEAKILAVADVVEAMSSERAYHKAFAIKDVLAELEKNKNILYDAAAVDACANLFLKRNFTWGNL